MTILSVFANSYAADGGLAGWTDPTNTYADDGVYATRTGTTKSVVYGNLFGFDLSALPDTATINSVTITAKWHNSANDSAGPVLVLGAKSGGATKGLLNDTSGQTADEVHSYSPTDLTAAQLKATGANGFWAILRFYRTDNTAHTASVDYVKVTIDYTDGAAEILGTADITLDGMTQAVTGAVDVTGISAVMLDGLTAVITGTVESQTAITGILDTTFDGLSASAFGAVIVTGESQNILSGLSMTATGLVGVTVGVSATLDGITGEITGIVGNAPVVGLLDATFAGLTCQMVGAVRVSGAASLAMDGVSAWITAWTEDLYSLQPGSKRIVRAKRPEPARAAAVTAMKHAHQESFKAEGD